MIEIIQKFAGLLFPVTVEATRLAIDQTHAIDISELQNGNILFSSSTFIVDSWFPMATIEIEPYTKDFWIKVGEALLTLSRHSIGYRSEFATTIETLMQKIPEGAFLSVEKSQPTPRPWRPKPNAGRRQTANFTGTIHSKKRAFARKLSDNPPQD